MRRRKRIIWSILLQVLPIGAKKIADILRKYKLYGNVGDNCFVQLRKLPLYSELVYLHNNICIGSNVQFVTHDAIHIMLNKKYKDQGFIEKVGCIEIMDNVFIGSGTQIMGDVRIGSNVIIGSGSLITKDIPDNSVYSGNPARCICSFDDFVETRMDFSETFKFAYGIDRIKGVDNELADKLYNEFRKKKDRKRKV